MSQQRTVTDTAAKSDMTQEQWRRIGALQVGAQLARGNGYRGLTSSEVDDALRLARFIMAT